MGTAELEKIWKAVLNELEVDLGSKNLGLYFKNTRLISLDNGVGKVGFRNDGVAQQTSARYYAIVQLALQKISQISPLSLIFAADPDAPKKESEKEEKDAGPLFAAPIDNKEEIKDAVKKSGMRADFSFEEFCVSTSNQLAFAAATATAQNPGKNYNPLFLWGGVGVGKTHLMQAVGHEILRKNPRARVIYASCEQFTNEIIAGIRSKNTADFKNKYRGADALLIDDIQFLAGKDRAQEEFFHTFNALAQNEKQVVLTSDTKPSEIKYIEDRLRSRFEGGMVADISTPDSELKTAICVAKAKKRGIELSNNLAFSIASRVDNIRSLEGKLQQIIMTAQTEKTSVTPELISRILKIPLPVENRLDARVIIDKVCQFYNLPMKLIKGEKRDKPIVVPRQIIMYLLKNKTALTYEEIAANIGRRDHTTIIHGVGKIAALLKTDEQVRQEVDKIVDSFTYSG